MIFPSGLIPARAGNTCASFQALVRTGAHPRSRGEHSVLEARELAGLGSSPLARGTQAGVFRLPPLVGLIPARAGNTCCCWSGFDPVGAHPRSRGEHGLVEQLQGVRVGSSPLARGTPFNPDILESTPGLIPARAGNTD